MGRKTHERETADNIDEAVRHGRDPWIEELAVHVFGPAGEIRDVPVVRPQDSRAGGAPVLQRLQEEGRATRPDDVLLDVAVKRSGSSAALSEALADLRRD